MKKLFINVKEFIKKNKFFIYVIPLIIYINITLIDTTTTFIVEKFSTYKSMLKYFCLAVILLKILICDLEKYKKNEYLKLFLIFIIFSLVTFFSENRAVIQYFIIIVGAYDLDIKKITKYVMIGECFCVLTIILLSLINIIPNRCYGRDNSNVKRYSLGFQFATYPALFVWYLTMIYLYIRNKKIKVFEYICLIAINIIMFVITNSRNELIFALLSIIVTIIYNKFEMKKIKKIINSSAKYLIFIFTIISVLLMNVYNPQNDTWNKIDKCFSGRLKYLYRCQQNYDIKLFGNKMEWIGLSDIYEGKYKASEFFYVDNSYINILYNYGVVFLLLINFAYYYTIKKESKKDEDLLIAMMALIIMHSFIDPQLVKIIYNIFILLFNNIIFDEWKIQFKKRGNNEYST